MKCTYIFMVYLISNYKALLTINKGKSSKSWTNKVKIRTSHKAWEMKTTLAVNLALLGRGSVKRKNISIYGQGQVRFLGQQDKPYALILILYCASYTLNSVPSRQMTTMSHTKHSSSHQHIAGVFHFHNSNPTLHALQCFNSTTNSLYTLNTKQSIMN